MASRMTVTGECFTATPSMGGREDPHGPHHLIAQAPCGQCVHSLCPHRVPLKSLASPSLPWCLWAQGGGALTSVTVGASPLGSPPRTVSEEFLAPDSVLSKGWNPSGLSGL